MVDDRYRPLPPHADWTFSSPIEYSSKTMLIDIKIEKMVEKIYENANRLKIIFFIIYTIAVFTTRYYASSYKDAIIYRLDDPLEAEYIGNDGEKQ